MSFIYLQRIFVGPGSVKRIDPEHYRSSFRLQVHVEVHI